MKIIDLTDIVRKDVPIYYRRIYTGTAIMEIFNERLQRSVEFAIETKPTGAKEISVVLMEEVEYPLVPLIKELKEVVSALDKSGVLPC